MYKLLKKISEIVVLVSVVEKGTTFDADLHEAITQIPVPTEAEKGKIFWVGGV